MTDTADRGGRPAATSAHELAAVAQRLFVEQGFDQTSVEDIARAAGISGRTFFRYFPTKADVLWVESEGEIGLLRERLAAGAPTERYEDVVVRAVVDALATFPDDQVEWARHRAQLVLREPAVQAQAFQRHARWRAAAVEYAGARTGQPVDALFPTAVGHAALAATLTAHEYWVAHPGSDLTGILEQALRLLLPAEPAG
ncbi:TetR family transcriptional regulator [Rhodococcus gannanensis]|uniref:TetR family transcriptional regulator n=1 Tax=Rhodococcus gannanensis TaxID=1960308 RepID=A0ABW4PAR2_9NOCA